VDEAEQEVLVRPHTATPVCLSLWLQQSRIACRCGRRTGGVPTKNWTNPRSSSSRPSLHSRFSHSLFPQKNGAGAFGVSFYRGAEAELGVDSRGTCRSSSLLSSPPRQRLPPGVSGQVALWERVICKTRGSASAGPGGRVSGRTCFCSTELSALVGEERSRAGECGARAVLSSGCEGAAAGMPRGRPSAVLPRPSMPATGCPCCEPASRWLSRPRLKKGLRACSEKKRGRGLAGCPSGCLRGVAACPCLVGVCGCLRGRLRGAPTTASSSSSPSSCASGGFLCVSPVCSVCLCVVPVPVVMGSTLAAPTPGWAGQ
jgi:hypothetical protein